MAQLAKSLESKPKIVEYHEAFLLLTNTQTISNQVKKDTSDIIQMIINNLNKYLC